jgi:hypothetical protein
MKVHVVEAFVEDTLAFFAFFNGLVTDFLQELKRLFTFFTLVLINRHGLLPS